MENFDGKLDGTLQSHIPAFEINWDDAKKMVELIHKVEEVVYLQATFDVTNSENTVEVDLWYSTSLDLGLNLSTELAAMSLTYSVDHAKKPLFTPRIATFPCLNCAEEFKRENCMSEGVYCAYTPNFYKEYELEEKGVKMLGKDILIQAIREKCLHKLMSEEYGDEGDMFFTFFSYIQKCFAHDMPLSGDKVAQSFDACYDWSTVKIHDEERVDYVNQCVEESFATTGDYETDNAILHDDRAWALANHIKLHPNVAINNITYTNSTGEDLALAICAAYREAPDECELAWKLQSFGSDEQFNSYEGLVTPHSDEGLFSQSQESH